MPHHKPLSLTEIRAWPVEELLRNMQFNDTNTAPIRRVIGERCAALGIPANPYDLAVHDYRQRNGNAAPAPMPTLSNSSFTWDEIRSAVNIAPYCQMILNSGWDYTDDHVKWTPRDIKLFLESMVRHEFSFEDLTKPQRNAMMMCFEAYLRWLEC